MLPRWLKPFGAAPGIAPDDRSDRSLVGVDPHPFAIKKEVFGASEPVAPGLPPFAHPQANRRIVLGQVALAYVFQRGRRSTIGFTVGADGLRVRAPRLTPLAEVEAVLRDKQRWILSKLLEAQQRQQQQAALRIDWCDGASLPFLGQPLVLRLDPRQRHGSAAAVLLDAGAPLAGADPSILQLGLPREATPEQIGAAAQHWLIGQARRLFTARLDVYAPQLGVRWRRLGLSSARTRWGSASADGSIRLNWRLIHLDLSLIDYVVVHELAHLHEMNHSPRFWQHVARVLPDHAERRRALHRHAPSHE